MSGGGVRSGQEKEKEMGMGMEMEMEMEMETETEMGLRWRSLTTTRYARHHSESICVNYG